MNKTALKEIWKAVHNSPGWMTRAADVLEPTEIDFLTDLDDAWLETCRQLQKQESQRPRSLGRPQVEIGWAIERRREYALEKMEAAKKDLVQARLERGRAVRAGHDFEDFFWRLYEADAMNEVGRFSAMMARQTVPESERITDDMIERARKVPIQAILESKTIKISCPFHEDKHPSASVSKGFFKCFSCGKRLDAIGWLVEIQGFSFPDAVRKLIK